MSESQGTNLFPQETVDQVISKLQNGQIISALDQVLSNEVVSQIATRRIQMAAIQRQINELTARINSLQAEVLALLNPDTTPESGETSP